MLKKSLYTLLIALALAGCSSTASNPIFRMAQHLFPKSNDLEGAQLDARYQFLRVTVGDKVILMASDTPDVDTVDKDAVWFSADREVLRLRNGRLVAVLGLATEWRNVALPQLPGWFELANKNEPFRWERVRDVMPGYLYGVKERLVLTKIATPTRSNLKGFDAKTLVWLEERLDTVQPAEYSLLVDDLPPARYAVRLEGDNATVVYGEQCVSNNFCFTWQRWPFKGETR